MKWIIGTLVMLFAVSMVAQQNTQSGSENLPPAMSYTTTVPNSTVRHNIQASLDTRGEFDSSNIATTVSGDKVVMEGNALTFGVKDDALQLASKYAGNRQIADDLSVGGSIE